MLLLTSIKPSSKKARLSPSPVVVQTCSADLKTKSESRPQALHPRRIFGWQLRPWFKPTIMCDQPCDVSRFKNNLKSAVAEPTPTTHRPTLDTLWRAQESWQASPDKTWQTSSNLEGKQRRTVNVRAFHMKDSAWTERRNPKKTPTASALLKTLPGKQKNPLPHRRNQTALLSKTIFRLSRFENKCLKATPKIC